MVIQSYRPYQTGLNTCTHTPTRTYKHTNIQTCDTIAYIYRISSEIFSIKFWFILSIVYSILYYNTSLMFFLFELRIIYGIIWIISTVIRVPLHSDVPLIANSFILSFNFYVSNSPSVCCVQILSLAFYSLPDDKIVS